MNTVKEVTSITSAYERYAQAFPTRIKGFKSALVRYLLPYPRFELDFQVIPEQRLSRQQVNQVLEQARKLNIETLSDINRVLSWQEKIFVSLNSNPNIRTVYKCHLKHFLLWCQEEGLMKPQRSEEWTIPISYSGPSRRHNRGNKGDYPITNRHSLISYGAKLEQFCESVQKQFREFDSFWTDPHYSSRRPISSIVEESTYKLCFRYVLQLLGWLTLDKIGYYHNSYEHAHNMRERNPRYESDWLLVEPHPPLWIEELNQKYPPRAIDQIKFEDLIPVVDIRSSKLDEWLAKNNTSKQNYSESQSQQLLDEIQSELAAKNVSLSFQLIARLGQALAQTEGTNAIKALRNMIQREEAKERIKLEAQDAAQSVRGFLNDYVKWLKFQHNPLSRIDGYRISSKYILEFYHAELNLAKFLYRDITDPVMYPDYKDIPVIMELRRMRSQEENSPSKANEINPIKRNPSWQELGQLLKKLLHLCSPRHQPCETWNVNLGRLRTQRGVAKDFQRYLIVMFFRIIAPDRQHVVRELKVHDTLRLYYLDWETNSYEEAPWDSKLKRYKVYFNIYTKLYYLDPADARDDKGNAPSHPQGKAFEWVVDLDETQTKTDRESTYRVPKIYNPELQAWLYGREDYSPTWHNWPTQAGSKQRSRYREEQFNWCGYVIPETKQLSGFRDIFQPQHDNVFTQLNGNSFKVASLRDLYENLIWNHLGIRANPHGVRSSATSYFERQGMTHSESKSLATLKNHSVEMQNSSAYNKLKALEKTAQASRMITEDFLKEHNLNSDEYGLA
ncbi:MAG: hypothetical protein KME12_21695 [Trichocoleus desertorum ATA4-8-CV12]|jgi:hypothetical protein|nr:hypothetical protein [Trichocoleus desertorum ATA4-8-CV12]